MGGREYIHRTSTFGGTAVEEHYVFLIFSEIVSALKSLVIFKHDLQVYIEKLVKFPVRKLHLFYPEFLNTQISTIA